MRAGVDCKQHRPTVKESPTGSIELESGRHLTHALVVGLARSGEAASLALATRGVLVRGYDGDDALDVGRLRDAGVEVSLGAADSALVDGIDVLVKSPGVPNENPLVREARARSLPVWSEVELGARLLPNPMLGVTGTNGKTTTTELLGVVFRAAGRDVGVAGNVGAPLTGLDGKLPEDEWIVCELSSFQLEDIAQFRPRVAVLLNITSDHLDRHETLAVYRGAKLRIFENQQSADIAVVPTGFGAIPGLALRVDFSADDELPTEPLIPGAHNRENAAAAVAAARAAGIAEPAIAEALATFPGVPHRLELVAEINGVGFVNDSKATNPEATERALCALPPGIRVILGGSRKGASFDALARIASDCSVLRAYLIGEAAQEIADALTVAGVPNDRQGNLDAAVRAAARDASPGEVVLLSPACASFDQFENSEARGDRFRELVGLL